VVEAQPVPDFCWTCGETFTLRAALDAHQLATGHELDQPDHPLRRLLAEARLRRHGWTRFEAGTRRAALRQIRRMNPDDDTPA